jgi:hypothetical protein
MDDAAEAKRKRIAHAMETLGRQREKIEKKRTFFQCHLLRRDRDDPCCIARWTQGSDASCLSEGLLAIPLNAE